MNNILLSYNGGLGLELLSGQKIGQWTIIEKDNNRENYKKRDERWICKCSCVTEKSVLGKYLKNKKSLSCGCTKKIINQKSLIGETNGNLTIIDVMYNYNGYNRATYVCKCACGNVIYIKGSLFKRTNSCGCSRLADSVVGNKYGKLEVIEMLYRYNGSETFCRCKCSCGNEKIVSLNSLKTGNTISCGCIHEKDLTGLKFGKLTVICKEYIDSKKLWKCRCDCGNIVHISSNKLISGHTSSCGCIRMEKTSKNEVLISSILKENNIFFYNNYSFADCKGIGHKLLRYDFYLPDYNICIEYDGVQHQKPIKFFGGEESFKRLHANDSIKNEYCKAHNINLIRIPYSYTTQKIKKTIIDIIQNPVTITA